MAPSAACRSCSGAPRTPPGLALIGRPCAARRRVQRRVLHSVPTTVFPYTLCGDIGGRRACVCSVAAQGPQRRAGPPAGPGGAPAAPAPSLKRAHAAGARRGQLLTECAALDGTGAPQCFVQGLSAVQECASAHGPIQSDALSALFTAGQVRRGGRPCFQAGFLILTCAPCHSVRERGRRGGGAAVHASAVTPLAARHHTADSGSDLCAHRPCVSAMCVAGRACKGCSWATCCTTRSG